MTNPPPGQQPPPKTPVMADVARLAGVSHQTVSRVINGQANIRPDTRARVEEAIRWLGYRPNTAARALGPHQHPPNHRAGRPRGELLRQLSQPRVGDPRASCRRSRAPSRPVG